MAVKIVRTNKASIVPKPPEPLQWFFRTSAMGVDASSLVIVFEMRREAREGGSRCRKNHDFIPLPSRYMIAPMSPLSPCKTAASQRLRLPRVESAVRQLLEGFRCSQDPAVRRAAAEVAARLEPPVFSFSIPEPGSTAVG